MCGWYFVECNDRGPERGTTIKQVEVVFPALDGLRLAGTVTVPEMRAATSAVLLHGNGTDREEFGLFTRLAAALESAGMPSLRFDMRGHGTSEGRQEDRTLSAHLNDIQAALAQVRLMTGTTSAALIATSFSGGVASWYAAHRPEEVWRLVLLNPQLDHKRRFIDEKPGWVDGFLDHEHTQRLNDQGYLDHTGPIRTGRALLNEVFWIRAQTVLHHIQTPTLLLHGTEDSLIPIESSRAAAQRIVGAQLIELAGAAHGFAVPGDGRFLEPQTQRWQSEVIDKIVAWLVAK